MPLSLSTEKMDLLLPLTAPASQRLPPAIMLALAYPEPGTNLGLIQNLNLKSIEASCLAPAPSEAGRRRRYLRYRSEWLRRLRLGVRSRRRIDAVAVAD
jgi:hypothetical protein